MSGQMPLGIELSATTAIARGDSRVDQCAWCGALVCWSTARPDGPKRLAICPACGHDPAEWWRQRVPVGPFKKGEGPDAV